MLAEILHGIAGFEKRGQSKYRPRPSNAGSERCIRAMVYHASNVPVDKQIGNRFVMVMDDSSWHEELTADWLRKSAFQLHSQQMAVNAATLDFRNAEPYHKCSMCGENIPDNVLHGHIDGVITDILGKDYLFEHKAVNHFSFEKYWDGDHPIDYITQCCLYITGLRKINPAIDTAILLIKNKNTSAFIDYKIQYDPADDIAKVDEICHSNGDRKHGNPYLLEMPNIISGAIERFRIVDEYVMRQEVPERPYEIGTSFPCSYCLYENTCFKDYEEDYRELAEDVRLEGGIEDLCKLYLEQVYQEREIKKHKEELKEKLKEALKANHASKGRAGEYLIHNRLQKEIRVKKKEDIPLQLLPMVTQEILKEVLSVTKVKEAKR